MSIRIPRFKPHLDPVIRPGEGVLLVSETAPRVLHGALYADVAALVDGVRDADAIVTALAGSRPAAEVHYALILMEKGGHIVDAAAPAGPDAAFWSELGRPPPSGTVRLHAFGATDPAPLAEALARLGLGTTPGDAPGGEEALAVALTDDLLHPGLPPLAAACRAAGRTLLLVRPIGFHILVGPLLTADTPPLEALTQRLALANPFRLLAPPIAVRAALPSTARIACELVATEIARLLAGLDSPLAGAVLSIDTRIWSSVLHRMLPLPAEPAGADASPRITLVERRVTDQADGGHRGTRPEETLARYEHLISPITGIVSGLAPITPPGEAFPVYVSGFNFAVAPRRLADTRKSLRSSTSGKGAGAAQAKASALGEALERASALFRGTEPRTAASYAAMRLQHGDAVIHPATVMRYSDRQYAERDAWNARESPFNVVPHRLPDDAVIDWSPLWSLTHEAVRYLPTQLLHGAAPAGPGDTTTYCIGCSNGHAAGNVMEEAILQGLFELIERDAIAIWWYNRLRRPGVDPAAFGDAASTRLVADAAAGGRRLWAIDITSDLGVPAFCAVSALDDAAGSQPLFGFGCHIDPRIALQRAFAESRQMTASIPSVMAAPDKAREVAEWMREATCDAHPYLRPDPAAPPPPPRSVIPSGEMRADILALRDMLAARGLEMLAMDQTRPDIGLPVAKVVVPGLRHFWARYAPGRLYDVPVALGWLTAPLDEAALNPVPIFI